MVMTSGNTGMTICGGTDAGTTPGNDGMAEADAVERVLCTAVASNGGPDEGGVERVVKAFHFLFLIRFFVTHL